jgi:hypothetical protein
MNGKKFPWGKVIEVFVYDFDGVKLEVTKYHPKKRGNSLSSREYEEAIEYHVEEMRASFNCMDSLLVAWIAHRNLGPGNRDSLVVGLCRALEIVP